MKKMKKTKKSQNSETFQTNKQVIKWPNCGQKL